MKRLFNLVSSCVFLLSNSYAQYVPERFAIKTTELAKNFDLVEKEYKFYVSADHLPDSIDWRENKPFPYDDHISTISFYTYVYVRGCYGIQNETFMLRLVKGQNVMTIYVRHYNYLDEGQVIQFDNFRFKNGNYFFDMSQTNTKYHIDRKQDGHDKTNVDCANLRRHKINMKKLKAILKANKHFEQ